MTGHLLACLLFFSNMKLDTHNAQPDQQKFWYFDYSLPYLSNYPPILTFPVGREDVFINLDAELFLLIAART